MVDHVVLFRGGEEEGKGKEEWLAKLNSLSSLDGIIYFKASRLLSLGGTSYTHGLYARFTSKQALQSYTVDPRHVAVVELGKTLFNDVLAVDWEIDQRQTSNKIDGTNALFILLLKLKPGAGPDSVPLGPVLSAGTNFSSRSKDFNSGFLLESYPKELPTEYCDDYLLVQLM